MVVASQVYNICLVDLSFLISFDNCLNIQLFRFHVSEIIHQDEQTVACVDSLYETNASITTVNIHIRSLVFLAFNKGRVTETYQILTVVEALASRSSM